MTIDELVDLAVNYDADRDELDAYLDLGFDDWDGPEVDDNVEMLVTRIAHAVNQLSDIVGLWTAAQDMANGYPK